MTATLRLDEAGRVVLPKSICDQLQLVPGSSLTAKVIDGKIEVSEDIPEVKIVRERGVRVISGWEGFDAAEAVREARERQLERLEAPPEP
jgi:bifunctional DNA-binding transcriptional regulator/antitoxin component of YhaV-PrlF toxin-antitoxin module